MGSRGTLLGLSLLGCSTVLASDSGGAALFLSWLRRRRSPDAPVLSSKVEPLVVPGRGLKVTAFWMATIGTTGGFAIAGGRTTLSTGSGMDSAMICGGLEIGWSTLRAGSAVGRGLSLNGSTSDGVGCGGGVTNEVKMLVSWTRASW